MKCCPTCQGQGFIDDDGDVVNILVETFGSRPFMIGSSKNVPAIATLLARMSAQSLGKRLERLAREGVIIDGYVVTRREGVAREGAEWRLVRE